MNLVFLKFGKALAISAFAILMTLQFAHSPLSHVHSCHCSESPTAESTESGCDDHTACPFACDHGQSNHSHEDQNSEHDGSGDCPHDGACQICEFLAQPLDFVAVPVLLDGTEIVNTLSEQADSQVCSPLPGSIYVRGPPLITS